MDSLFVLVRLGASVAILALVAFIDWRKRVVYWGLVVAGSGAGILLVGSGEGLVRATVGLAVGYAVFGVFYWAGRWRYSGREPLGKGDIGIAALVGALVGFPDVLGALAAGSLATGVIGGLALLTRRLALDSYVPFGPGLCFGGVFALCRSLFVS